jgi:hypothetical protein
VLLSICFLFFEREVFEAMKDPHLRPSGGGETSVNPLLGGVQEWVAVNLWYGSAALGNTPVRPTGEPTRVDNENLYDLTDETVVASGGASWPNDKQIAGHATKAVR